MSRLNHGQGQLVPVQAVSTTAIATRSAGQQLPVDQPARHDWQVVLRSREGVVVLYNTQRRILAVQSTEAIHDVTDEVINDSGHNNRTIANSLQHAATPTSISNCPLCKRPFSCDKAFQAPTRTHYRTSLLSGTNDAQHFSANYFHLLSESHQSSPSFVSPEPSRPGTPTLFDTGGRLNESAFLDGYYGRFFKEIANLGRGMSGSVFLCQHVLNGNHLGYFACKKIPVGNSSPSLVKALKEINHLESLRHANIVAIHHVWLEQTAINLGPPVPCLFALMDYANSGSLDKYISFRGGLRGAQSGQPPTSDELKAKYRKRRQSRSSNNTTDGRAVHLFSLEEILSLAQDVGSGLAFLHSHNILHLDLKAENILLHRQEADVDLIPTAMLSDFGSSEARNARAQLRKTGTTGTLDYLAPESFIPLPSGRPRPHTAALDLWALGLVLHLLAFFELPYAASDVDELTDEIKDYSGYTQKNSRHRRRDLPPTYPALLEQLINLDPNRRPSAGKVMQILRDVRLADIIVEEEVAISGTTSGIGCMSVVRRKSISVGTRALSPPVRPTIAPPQLGPVSSRPSNRLLITVQKSQLRNLLWLGFRLTLASAVQRYAGSQGTDINLRLALSLLLVSTTEALTAVNDLTSFAISLIISIAYWIHCSR